MADTCWGLTENNKILQSNYRSIKNKLIKKINLWAFNISGKFIFGPILPL